MNRFVHQVRGALATASGVELFRLMPALRGPVRWLEHRPVLHGLALSAFGLRRPIFIDHPTRPEPRFGYGRPADARIAALLAAGRERYARRLRAILRYADSLAAIGLRGDLDGADPYWLNGWLPPLDAASLYGTLAAGNPRRYVEIGSGNSTKFAHRARADHGLRTEITSIDPAPRAAVDALCDRVVRSPLERTDLALFAALSPGDIVFFDGSHRAEMGSDVAVFFFELLPQLPPGVLVHIHDILLPNDYPPQWRWRHYNEQYVLAAYLLGGGRLADDRRLTVELPNAYVAGDASLSAVLAPLWQRLALPEHYLPASFWLGIER